MGHFIREDFITGKLRCFLCNKLLFIKSKGTFEVELTCPRCKTYIKIKTIEPIPIKTGT